MLEEASCTNSFQLVATGGILISITSPRPKYLINLIRVHGLCFYLVRCVSQNRGQGCL
jgi:hypothetical protein